MLAALIEHTSPSYPSHILLACATIIYKVLDAGFWQIFSFFVPGLLLSDIVALIEVFVNCLAESILLSY